MCLSRKIKRKNNSYRISQDRTKTAEDREKLRALDKAISELPQKLKSPLLLTALEGLSQIETGQLLGISAKAVETKVYRARKLLLEKMNKMGF
jgi:RNA polymerase sigma-70 factor (ECF subfamily)